MGAKERDQRKAHLPAGLQYSFPQRCVVCLDPQVVTRDLRTASYQRFFLGVEGTAQRYLEATLPYGFTGVSYCAAHAAELDARVTKSQVAHQAEATTPGWLKGLIVAGSAVGPGFVGLLFNERWGFFIGAIVGIFAIGIPLLSYVVGRRARQLGGSPAAAGGGGKGKAKFYGGYQGHGGTLGFFVFPIARVTNEAAGTVTIDALVLDFQNEEYAGMFRSSNGLKTPDQTKQDAKAQKKADRVHRREVRAGRAEPQTTAPAAPPRPPLDPRVAQAKNDGDVPALLRLLEEDDDAVQFAVVQAFLTLMPDQKQTLIDPVIAFIRRGGEGEVRRRAAMFIRTLPADPRIFELLLESIHDDDVALRRHAAMGLASYPEARAVEGLVELLGSEDSSARQNAVKSLAKMGPVAHDALVGASRHDDPDVRKIAQEHL